ncbi:unnamed protein product [Symbiodinium sp. CCMP2592]|nr:unnamed protein product [Symbiodinium sp. CCMP2592]
MASPPPSETLFVTGLPMDSTSESAKQVFSQYGAVKQTTVLPVLAGKTAAAAFVIMETVEDAQWIVDNVNGNVPQGLMSQVTVVFATPREQRKGGGKGKMKGTEVPVGEVVVEVTGAAPTEVARAKDGEKLLIWLMADGAERPLVRPGASMKSVMQWVERSFDYIPEGFRLRSASQSASDTELAN